MHFITKFEEKELLYEYENRSERCIYGKEKDGID